MPEPKVKIRRKYLFEDMVLSLETAMSEFPDKRTGDNTQYRIVDVGKQRLFAIG